MAKGLFSFAKRTRLHSKSARLNSVRKKTNRPRIIYLQIGWHLSPPILFAIDKTLTSVDSELLAIHSLILALCKEKRPIALQRNYSIGFALEGGKIDLIFVLEIKRLQTRPGAFNKWCFAVNAK